MSQLNPETHYSPADRLTVDEIEEIDRAAARVKQFIKNPQEGD